MFQIETRNTSNTGNQCRKKFCFKIFRLYQSCTMFSTAGNEIKMHVLDASYAYTCTVLLQQARLERKVRTRDRPAEILVVQALSAIAFGRVLRETSVRFRLLKLLKNVRLKTLKVRQN